ncbi:MAG TPA: hypothetical protein VF980_05785, partial [Thermoanaerobaculia bacterium]
LRFPVKSLELTLVPMALLAGSGVAAATAAARPLVIAAVVTAAALAVLAITFAMSDAFRATLTRAFFVESLPRASAMLLSQSFIHAAVASALFLLAIESRREFAIAALVLLDLAFAGWRVNPYAPRELFDTPPLAATIRSILTDHGKLYRTPDPYVQRLNVPANENVWLAWWDLQLLSRYTAATFGIPLVFHEDYDGLALLRMKRMTEGLSTMPWTRRLNVLSAAGATAIVTPDAIQSPLVDVVKTVRGASGAPLYVYRNRASRPARFAATSVVIRDDAQAFSRLSSLPFDANTVILSDGIAAAGQPRVPATVRIVGRTDNEWSAEVEAPCGGWVVFAETWFPGWRVRVDGAERPLVRADVAFSAVQVPAGHHIVTKTYRPILPLAGLAGSVLTALFLAFFRFNQ